MARVTPESVPGDALVQWQDIHSDKPSPRSVLRWITNGTIVPAHPSTGPGNPIRFSPDDVKALVELAKVQRAWGELFSAHSMPNQIVCDVWNAVHGGMTQVVVQNWPVRVVVELAGQR